MLRNQHDFSCNQ